MCARATAAIFASLALLVTFASVVPDCAGPAITVAVVLMIVGSTAASTWHGIAYTELATIAGMKHVGAALGLGNTFAFSTYFLTPLAIPFVLDASAWQGMVRRRRRCTGCILSVSDAGSRSAKRLTANLPPAHGRRVVMTLA